MLYGIFDGYVILWCVDFKKNMFFMLRIFVMMNEKYK